MKSIITFVILMIVSLGVFAQNTNISSKNQNKHHFQSKGFILTRLKTL